MRRTKTLTALLAAATVAMVGFGATAANAGTGVTFQITAGAISISEPSAVADLGTVASSATGTTTSGSLGLTTVSDLRGSLAGWTSTIATSDFSDGATPTPHTIAAAKAAAYLTGAPTVVSGIAVPTSTYTALSPLTLGTSAANFVTSTAVGSNVVTFNPTVKLTIDSGVVAGTYTGTVTQTVS